MGLGHGATVYHLGLLERGGLVTVVKLEKFRRYYLTGSHPRTALRGEARLAAPSARKVYEAVRREPGTTLSTLADRVSVTPPSAHRTVAKLQEAGLVERRLEGSRVRIVAREPQGANYLVIGRGPSAWRRTRTGNSAGLGRKATATGGPCRWSGFGCSRCIARRGVSGPHGVMTTVRRA